MADTIDGFHAKVTEVSTCVQRCAALTGSCQVTVGGEEVPGLGLDAESDILCAIAKDLQNGVFKVLTMGEFKNGKSTLLNALIGNTVLPANEIATTAIITILVYGQGTDRAKVFFSSKPESLEMSIEQFNAQYKLTPQDEAVIYGGEAIDRFADVDYALIECDSPLCQDGVRLVDSPGISEAEIRNKITMRYAITANAILFVLSAVHLLSRDEKIYIQSHFMGKAPRNVFFIVNRVDQITGDLAEVKEYAAQYLRHVFTDENGRFDQALFDDRLFYTDAYGTLQAKQEGRYDQAPDSEFDRLERSLKQFLTSDDRAAASLTSVLITMAHIYGRAAHFTAVTKKALTMSQGELAQKAVLSQEELYKAQREIQKITKACQSTANLIKAKVYASLWDYVGSMEAAWEADSESIGHKINIGDMLKLSVTRNAKKRNDIAAPLVNALQEYIQTKLHTWAEMQETLIEPEIHALMREIDTSAVSFDLRLQKAADLFAGGLAENPAEMPSGVKIGQLLINFIFFDPSMFVTGAALGGFSWGEFLRKSIVQYIITWVIFGLFSGGFAWLVFIAAEVLHMHIEANRLNEKVLLSIKRSLFAKLKQSVADQRAGLDEAVQSRFDTQAVLLTQGLYRILEEEKRHQTQIMAKKREHGESIEQEVTRLDSIRDAIKNEVGRVYQVIYGREANADEIKGLTMTGSES